MDPEATSRAVAASMLGHPEAGLQRKIFTAGGEGGAEHLLCSLASPGSQPWGYVTGLALSHPEGLRQGLGEEGDQTKAQNSHRRRDRWPRYLGKEMKPLTQQQGGRGERVLQTASPPPPPPQTIQTGPLASVGRVG